MSALEIIPLGGVGEIGKNMIAYRRDGALLLVDCGIMFPDEEMLGVDIVIPDMTWVRRHAAQVVGLVLTHGHEDHVGAVPYLLHEVRPPLWGTRLTLGILAGKLREHGFAEDELDIHVVAPGDRFRVGPFDVEFVHVCHSIPDCVAVVLHTPEGAVVQSGDYKFDQTPVDGRPTDVGRLARLGDEGVLTLLTDCTNAAKPGFTPSERTVGQTFEQVFAAASGRVIVATFASNIHRIQQVIDVSHAFGRQVAAAGRSMVANIDIAARMGYLKLPDKCLVELDEVDLLPPEHVSILTTGSQGEPLSALSLMARQDHRKLQVESGDTVIVSATPIPGNEAAIHRTLNRLARLGADLLYDEIAPVHVSGHGNQEDLKLMLHLLRPRFVVPYHGEYRHIALYRKLARAVGYDDDHLLTARLGEALRIEPDRVTVSGHVPSGSIMIDGLGFGDIGSEVLRDRRHLAEDGVLICVVSVARDSGEILAGPYLVARGVAETQDSEEILEKARLVVTDALNAMTDLMAPEAPALRSTIRSVLRRFLSAQTKRRPMILPVVMEV